MRRAMLILALTACGGDGGVSGPGGGVGGGGLTNGSVCTQLITAICAHIQEQCEPTTTMEVCVGSGVAACCTNAGTCNIRTVDTQGEINSCVSDLSTYPCAALAANTLPASCEIL